MRACFAGADGCVCPVGLGAWPRDVADVRAPCQTAAAVTAAWTRAAPSCASVETLFLAFCSARLHLGRPSPPADTPGIGWARRKKGIEENRHATRKKARWRGEAKTAHAPAVEGVTCGDPNTQLTSTQDTPN